LNNIRLAVEFQIKNKKLQPLTSAKPQAATQANTPSLRPRPSYPLYGMLEPVGFGSCNFESKKQPQKWRNFHERKIGTAVSPAPLLTESCKARITK